MEQHYRSEELADFVCENYFKKQYIELFDSHPDKILVSSGEEGIRSLAFFVRLSDENFDKLIDEELNTLKTDDMQICLNDNGHNIHFILLCSKVHNFEGIFQELKGIIEKENAKTVSWFTIDRSDLIIKNIWY